jgi:hypothetical protein
MTRRKLTKAELRALGATPGVMAHRRRQATTPLWAGAHQQHES